MREKILLCIVTLDMRNAWTPEDEASEMKELIESCGGEVVDTVFCKAIPPTASHLITKGKVEEIQKICQQGGVDCVVIAHDLKGRQQRNLEEDFGVKTLDRTQVILDIFAKHASSLEGKMQVELAQLQYMLPRLVGSNTELSRQGGGIGTSGPGETKLEVDRRRISARIARLKADLKDVARNRQLKRKRRKEQEVLTVALVGYTNAGKSTLLNALTGAGAVTHDGLFTTLDSLSRQTVLPNNRKVIFSDTVGFMHDLPHGLIEAFKATLEEVQQADLLLHVIDISNDNYKNLHEAVNRVLDELKLMDKLVILVLNKIDKLTDQTRLKSFNKITKNCIGISAAKGENIQMLLVKIEEMSDTNTVEIDVLLPPGRMDLVNMAHKQGRVHDMTFTAKGIRLKAAVSSKIAGVINGASA